MTLKLAKNAFLSSSTSLCLTYGAFALDADKFGEQLKATFLSSGASIEYGAIQVDGDQVVLQDTKMTSSGQSFPTGTLRFNGVDERDDGTIRIETTIIEDITHKGEDFSFTLGGIEIGGLLLPTNENEASSYPYMLYERAVIGPVTFTRQGVDIFKMSGSEVRTDIADDLKFMQFDGSASGIVIDLSTLKDPRARHAITSMGYQTLRGDVQIKGDWDAKTGRVNIPQYALTLQDAGRLNIALDIGGYTLELIRQLQDIQQQMDQQSDPKAQQAAGMASLGLMQQLTLNAASIRFDDASLTEKALKFAGSKQGMSAQQTAQTAKALLPFLLGRLGMPELQQQISAAASVYLDNPQNIEIKATPPAPVPFGQIAGAAMLDPRSISAMIGVEVTANQ